MRALWNRATCFAAAQLLVSAFNYVFFALFVQHLSPQEVGTANAILSALFLLAVPTMFLQNLVTNQLSIKKAYADESFVYAVFRTLTRIVLVGVFILSIVLLLLATPLHTLLRTDSYRSIALLVACNAFNYLLPVPRGIWQAQGRFVELSCQLLLEVIVKILGFFVLLYIVPPVAAILLSILLSYAVSLAWLMIAQLRTRFVERKRITDRMRVWLVDAFSGSGRAFFVAMLLFTALYNLDILLINYRYAEQSASYSIAARIVQLVLFGGMSIATANLSRFYTTKGGVWAALKEPLLTVAVGVSGFYAGMTILGSWVLGTFFGAEFVSALPLVLTLGVAGSCYAFSIVLLYFLISKQRFGFLWELAAATAALIAILILGLPFTTVINGIVCISIGLLFCFTVRTTRI